MAERTRTENGSGYPDMQQRQRASAYQVALSPTALQNIPTRRIIDDTNWHNTSTPDFHQRFSVGQHYFPPNPGYGPRSLPSDASTMAVTSSRFQFQSQFGSAYPPSLTESSGETAQTPSVRTSTGELALDQNQRLLVDDGNGNFVTPAPERSTWQCAYWYLACSVSVSNVEEWDAHNQRHFRTPDGRISLPPVASCPFSCSWIPDTSSSRHPWSQRQAHIQDMHPEGGQIDKSKRADKGLIDHLWQNSIIGPAQEKQLRQYGYIQESAAPYLVNNGARSRNQRGTRRPGEGRETNARRV